MAKGVLVYALDMDFINVISFHAGDRELAGMVVELLSVMTHVVKLPSHDAVEVKCEPVAV